MILTRITARPGAPLPSDVYDAHRLVWQLFSDGPDRRRDFLFRVDPDAITALSERLPVSPGAFRVESHRFDLKVNAGDRYSFRLRVNPTRAIPEHGKRGVRTDAIRDGLRLHRKSNTHVPEDQVIHISGAAWLASRRNLLGCEIDTKTLHVSGYRSHHVRPGHGRAPIQFVTIDFTGELTVTDAARFLETVRAGIGHEKAFGCGLMLLGEVEQ